MGHLDRGRHPVDDRDLFVGPIVHWTIG